MPAHTIPPALCKLRFHCAVDSAVSSYAPWELKPSPSQYLRTHDSSHASNTIGRMVGRIRPEWEKIDAQTRDFLVLYVPVLVSVASPEFPWVFSCRLTDRRLNVKITQSALAVLQQGKRHRPSLTWVSQDALILTQAGLAQCQTCTIGVIPKTKQTP